MPAEQAVVNACNNLQLLKNGSSKLSNVTRYLILFL